MTGRRPSERRAPQPETPQGGPARGGQQIGAGPPLARAEEAPSGEWFDQCARRGLGLGLD